MKQLRPLLLGLCLLPLLSSAHEASPAVGYLPPANPGVWRNIGYSSWVDGHAGAHGVFVAVAPDPSNHDRLLAATERGGIWLTEDAGKTWRNTDHEVPGMNYFRALIFARKTPGLAYAGCYFGVLKSTDGGRSWTKLADPLIDRTAKYPNSEGTEPQQVFMDTSADGRVVVYATQTGTFRSDDAGASWRKVSDKAANSFKLHPEKPDIMYLAASKYGRYYNACDWTEFFRSEDAGKTWTQVTAGLPVEQNGRKREQLLGYYVRTCPARPDRIVMMGFGGNTTLAGKHNVVDMWSGKVEPILYGVKGVWISEDCGKTFRNVWNDANDVLPPTRERPNLCENVDRGDDPMSGNWTKSALHQGMWDLAFEISDTDPDLWVAGGHSPWLTRDGGKTWTHIREISYKNDKRSITEGGGLSSFKTHWCHGDFQSAAFLGHKLWMGNDGGINFSDDYLKTCHTLDTGSTAVEPWGFDMSWRDPNVMIMACNHGPVHVKHPMHWGEHWLNVGGGDSSQCFVNPADPAYVYGPWSVVKIIPPAGTPEPAKAVKTYGFGGDLFHSHATPFDARRAYALYGQRKHKSGGKSDLLLFNGRSTEALVRTFDAYIDDLTTAHGAPGFVFLCEGRRLWLSRDSGANWAQVTPTEITGGAQAQPWGKSGYTLTRVACDPLKPSTLYAAGASNRAGQAGFVLRSLDGGKTWTDVTGGLYSEIKGDGPVRDLECQAGTDGGVYVITASRFAYRNLADAAWRDLGEGLPAANHNAYVKASPALGRVRLCSNKGVFERTLAEPSKPFIATRVDTPVQYPHNGPYTVRYFDVSSVSAAGKVRWSFPGGTPSQSNEMSPVVTYAKPGVYKAFVQVAEGSVKSKAVSAAEVSLGMKRAAFTKGPGGALNFRDPSSVRTELVTPIRSAGLTIAAWLKVEDDPRRGFATVAALSDDKHSVSLILTKEGELRVSVDGSGWQRSTGVLVPNGVWTHVAIACRAGEVDLFLNGKKSATTKIGFQGPYEFNRGDMLTAGCRRDGGEQYLGRLDELSVWAQALGEPGVGALMAGKVAKRETGLVAHFQFDAPPEGGVYVEPAFGHTLAPGGAISEIANDRLTKAVKTLKFPAGDALADLRDEAGKKAVYAALGMEKPPVSADASLGERLLARQSQPFQTPLQDPVVVEPSDRPEPAGE